jgi:hypothetical protein
MDLLVLEEMHTSSLFRQWLVSKIYNNARHLLYFKGAWHAFADDELGQVDILFLFEDDEGHKSAILIENKIDQPKQDLQAERYFEFGAKGVKLDLWNDYMTCLLAPQAYFGTLAPSEYFASYLSYEDLADWFSRASMGDRGMYKFSMIHEAIKQGTLAASESPASGEDAPKKGASSEYRVFPGGVFNLPKEYKEDEDTILAHFWKKYGSFCADKYPSLNMQKPMGNAFDAGWSLFQPDTFPQDVRIIHKMPQGFVDLLFIGASKPAIQTAFTPHLDTDMQFKESGNSVAIRIGVPPIDPEKGFDREEELILFALQKVKKLYDIYDRSTGTNKGI